MSTGQKNRGARLMHPIRRWSLTTLCVSLLSFTACGFRSSTEQARKDLKAVTSWAATAYMVGDARTARAVPKSYAVQTLLEARQKLRGKLRTLQSQSVLADEVRNELLEHLRRLEQTVRQMIEAVEQEDATALVQRLKQLSTDRQTITLLLAGGGARI